MWGKALKGIEVGKIGALKCVKGKQLRSMMMLSLGREIIILRSYWKTVDKKLYDTKIENP